MSTLAKWSAIAFAVALVAQVMAVNSIAGTGIGLLACGAVWLSHHDSDRFGRQYAYALMEDLFRDAGPEDREALRRVRALIAKML